jgi:hypothetical protein
LSKMLTGQKLKFYLLRIKNATVPELIQRAWEAMDTLRLRIKFHKGRLALKIPAISTSVIASLRLPEFQYEVAPQVFKSLASGGVFTLNGDRQTIEKFEEKWRGVFFGDVPLTLPEFDLRMVWEPARLQHLTILMLYAEAHRGSLDSDHLKAMVKGAILDWIDKNPFLYGFHYRSAMECALRIPVFFYALKILDNLDPGEKNRILETIYQHAWWISRRLSLYSSLGNHTVCECVGLIFAGAIFASTTEGRVWMPRALALLWQELHHQILADGGPAEQSFGYLRFILDLYWLVIDFLEKNHLHDCTAWKPRLVMGENFLKDFHDTLKQIPSIGDSDDGYAIAPGIFPRRAFEI